MAEALTKPRRVRISVNVARVGRATRTGETVVVPGKVLGSGEIGHPLKVAALSFSAQGRKKIEAAGGSCLAIEQLIKENPKGVGVRIIG